MIFWHTAQVLNVIQEVPEVYVYLLCIDDARVYGYVRFETGDEMSRRAKFAFITWIGPSVSPLKKAKVSTDKAFVKKIMNVSLLLLLPTRKALTHPPLTAIWQRNSSRWEIRVEAWQDFEAAWSCQWCCLWHREMSSSISSINTFLWNFLLA